MMVAEDENDLASLRKRDGTHLEVIDCPDVAADDFGTQKLRAICLNNGPDSNCLEITNGGVEGTIVRLPEECTSDHYVRAVSFEESKNRTLPAHLAKRDMGNYKIYDLHFDYNFSLLRRDGSDVHIRIDVSNHPGYWDSIVSPPADAAGRRMKRTTENWRQYDKRWFSEGKEGSDWVDKLVRREMASPIL
jgi:chitinase